MILFADTNWLVAAYFVEQDGARTRQVQRFTAAHHEPWVVSPLVEFEAKNVFARISRQPNGSAWRVDRKTGSARSLLKRSLEIWP